MLNVRDLKALHEDQSKDMTLDFLASHLDFFIFAVISFFFTQDVLISGKTLQTLCLSCRLHTKVIITISYFHVFFNT